MVPGSPDPLLSHARARGVISTDEAMRLLGVSRATAQRRLRALVAQERLVREGAGRGARYVLPKTRWERTLGGLEEDRLWGEVRPALTDLGLSERELGTVGQGFCDEVFRVFAAAHPEVVLVPTGMNESVSFMVRRARRMTG